MCNIGQYLPIMFILLLNDFLKLLSGAWLYRWGEFDNKSLANETALKSLNVFKVILFIELYYVYKTR